MKLFDNLTLKLFYLFILFSTLFSCDGVEVEVYDNRDEEETIHQEYIEVSRDNFNFEYSGNYDVIFHNYQNTRMALKNNQYVEIPMTFSFGNEYDNILHPSNDNIKVSGRTNSIAYVNEQYDLLYGVHRFFFEHYEQIDTVEYIVTFQEAYVGLFLFDKRTGKYHFLESLENYLNQPCFTAPQFYIKNEKIYFLSGGESWNNYGISAIDISGDTPQVINFISNKQFLSQLNVAENGDIVFTEHAGDDNSNRILHYIKNGTHYSKTDEQLLSYFFDKESQLYAIGFQKTNPNSYPSNVSATTYKIDCTGGDFSSSLVNENIVQGFTTDSRTHFLFQIAIPLDEYKRILVGNNTVYWDYFEYNFETNEVTVPSLELPENVIVNSSGFYTDDSKNLILSQTKAPGLDYSKSYVKCSPTGQLLNSVSFTNMNFHGRGSYYHNPSNSYYVSGTQYGKVYLGKINGSNLVTDFELEPIHEGSFTVLNDFMN